MLPLSSRGDRIERLACPLAPFCMDGGNLSTHGQILIAVEGLRLRHGTFDNALLRPLVSIGRHIERLVRGWHAEHMVTHTFAKAPLRHYSTIPANELCGRDSISEQGRRQWHV